MRLNSPKGLTWFSFVINNPISNILVDLPFVQPFITPLWNSINKISTRIRVKFSSARRATSSLGIEKFFPINLSSRELDPDEKSLLSKGPSFCPVPRDIDRLKLQEDWEKFENRLRAATFFFNNCDINSSPTEVERKPVFPTVKKVSSWKAPVSKFPEVELFLESVKKELFDPTNVSIVHDNLSVGERKAFYRLKNLDEQVIKIQICHSW